MAENSVLTKLNAALTDNELILLKQEGDIGFVIFKDIVALQEFHKPGGMVTWEISSTREWLNKEFDDSLPEEIKTRIIESDVENKDNCAVPGGNDTKDKVFLLSLDEYTNILPEDIRASHYKGARAWYWLRSPGYSSGDVANVCPDGNLDGGPVGHGFYANCDAGGIRPAFRLSLKP